jgi:hypothetical protein
MTDKPKKLSDTARAVLTLAATRDDHLIRPPHCRSQRLGKCPIAIGRGTGGGGPGAD